MTQITLQQTVDLAVQHHQAGRLHEAEKLYRLILAERPDHVDAMQNLAVIAHQVGRNDAAVELFRRVIALKPDLAEAHNNLGNALKAQGRLDEAMAAYLRAIALKVDYAEAHYNLGIALADKTQFDQAIAEYRQATALRADYAEAYNNLGIALKRRLKLDEAILAYRQAIAVSPSYAEAHNNLGNALRERGRGDEAVAAYRRAIALKGGFAEAHGNLGIALTDQGELDDAIAACRQAIALNPNLPETHSNLVFTLHYDPAYNARAIAEELRRWNRQHAEPLRKFILPHTNDASPDRPLRIGYVSPDFREHVVGRNVLPLFRCHDHQQFATICYAHVLNPDGMTSEFQRNSECWRNILGVSDEEAARQVHQDRIDILVDLALHTADNRLLVFARKPAPVQVTFAGYPGSTGLSTIDYRLSDPYLDPPDMDESVYSERTIRLPDSFWCYDPLDAAAIPVNSLPAQHSGVVTFGCLNKFFKLNEVVLALWARVLRQVENSRLLLLAPPGSPRQRTLDRLSQEGITASRVEFALRQPRMEYMKLYHRIDLGLDSFPYNGHTTSLDSFWMGVPVVTLVGQTAVWRAGWCQLSNLGLTELAAHTPEQFVQIAVELAKDLPRLANLRSTLRGRMEQSPLMDVPRFARNVEATYRQMWRNWCEGKSTKP